IRRSQQLWLWLWLWLRLPLPQLLRRQRHWCRTVDHDSERDRPATINERESGVIGMSRGMALKIAIDLVHVPSQVRLYRSSPLPDDVLTLLRIVAGDTDAERGAAAATDRPPQVIRRAAAFFIEQILFAPDADSYQVLGESPQASSAELRRNLGLLLRWLHPDLDPRGERSIFIGRVTRAWNDLKTPERRAAYDQARRIAKEKDKGQPHRKMGQVRSWRYGNRRTAVAQSERRDANDRRLLLGFLRRAVSVLFQAS